MIIFDSYLAKFNDSSNNVFYTLCKYKNQHKQSSNATKCDIDHSKQYYANHFHSEQAQSIPTEDQWHPISYCISKEEYDAAYELFTFDKVKQAVQTTNAKKVSGDDIPAKALKYLGDSAIELLQSIFIQSYLR